MRNADVYDLASERRLGAVLDFAFEGAHVLLLNGGSHAEEIVVVVHVRARTITERYCIDAGTSVQIPVLLSPSERMRDVRVEIVGGPGTIVLCEPARMTGPTPGTVRALAGTTAALLLMFLGIQAVDPIRPSVHTIVSERRTITKKKIVTPHANALTASHAHARTVSHTRATRSVQLSAIAPKMLAAVVHHPRSVPRRWYPRPIMSTLKVPSIVRSGEAVRIAYRAIAERVRIVASIGPTIVARRVLSATHGVIAIHPPPSNREGRVMTVRAYAQNGTRVASLQTMVVLVHSPQ